jgi:hypothetical protein
LSRSDVDSGALLCRACRAAIGSRAEIGWECDCGALVCAEPDCFEEIFKHVAGGEATRCLACGQVS